MSSPVRKRPLPPWTLLIWLLLLQVGCGGPAFIWAKDVPPGRALPAAADERIRSGDSLAVTVSGQPQLSGSFLVGADGAISLPDLGPIRVEGQTPQAATLALTARIASIIQTPRVSVVVAQRRLQVAILGEVRSPGKHLLSSGDGVVEAIASAGGLGEFANGNAIYLVRSDEPVRIRFRMKDLLRGGASARSFVLRDGDLIIVE
jgi:polysaccharide export outer membrane protein